MRWLALLAIGVAGSAQAAEAPVYTLPAAHDLLEIDQVLASSGPSAAASLDLALRGRLPLKPTRAGALHDLGPGRSLWLRLRVQAPRPPTEPWLLTVPLPVIDAVTLNQRTESGGWHAQAAGDTIAHGQWPYPGRYPVFRLQFDERGIADLYLQVQHGTPVTLPIRIVTASRHQERLQLEYLGLGMALGALALLTAGSLGRAWTLRDSAYAWYAGYALLATLALAAFTGVAGHVLWSRAGAWVDAAPGCLALLGAAVAMLVTAHLSSVTTRVRRLGRAVQWVGWGGMAAAPVYLFLQRDHGVILLGLYLLTVAVLSLTAATITWRRGDPVGRWMLWGAVPLAVAVLVALARVLNWMEGSWFSEYALVLALTINLPTLFGALNSRSRERRGAQLRQVAAASQDPLTGLLKAQPFLARLDQALQRYHRRGEGAAIALIEIANYDWIKSSRGAEAAEEALLRAVIKLRHLVRDVDTTGRLGEARFGLILEGVNAPEVVRERATRLVAAGLMEEPERPQDAVLQFRIVANLLGEYAPAPGELLLALQRTLRGMHPRTRRPFRMLDPHDILSSPPSSGGLEVEPPPEAEAPPAVQPPQREAEDSGPETLVEPRPAAGST